MLHRRMRYNVRQLSIVMVTATVSSSLSVFGARTHCWSLGRLFSTNIGTTDNPQPIKYNLETGVESIKGRRPHMEDEYVISKDNR